MVWATSIRKETGSSPVLAAKCEDWASRWVGGSAVGEQRERRGAKERSGSPKLVHELAKVGHGVQGLNFTLECLGMVAVGGVLQQLDQCLVNRGCAGVPRPNQKPSTEFL